MRVFCVLLVLACVLVAGCSKSDSERDQQTTQIQDTMAGETLIYYTCPMASHKDVHSDQPGACTQCGMALVKAVTTTEDKMEFYGCPMEAHSHVRGDAPDLCGMLYGIETYAIGQECWLGIPACQEFLNLKTRVLDGCWAGMRVWFIPFVDCEADAVCRISDCLHSLKASVSRRFRCAGFEWRIWGAIVD